MAHHASRAVVASSFFHADKCAEVVNVKMRAIFWCSNLLLILNQVMPARCCDMRLKNKCVIKSEAAQKKREKTTKSNSIASESKRSGPIDGSDASFKIAQRISWSRNCRNSSSVVVPGPGSRPVLGHLGGVLHLCCPIGAR